MTLINFIHVCKFRRLNNALDNLKCPSTDEDYKLIDAWKDSSVRLIEKAFRGTQDKERFVNQVKSLFVEPYPIVIGNQHNGIGRISPEERKDVFTTSISEARELIDKCVLLLKT